MATGGKAPQLLAIDNLSSFVDMANACLGADGRHVVPTPLQFPTEKSSDRGSRAYSQ